MIDTRTPIMFLDVRLQPGVSYTQPVPEEYQGFAYVWCGSGYLGKGRAPAKVGQAGLFGQGDDMFHHNIFPYSGSLRGHG